MTSSKATTRIAGVDFLVVDITYPKKPGEPICTTRHSIDAALVSRLGVKGVIGELRPAIEGAHARYTAPRT